ncbi:hypothetical protein Tco_0954172 [Tanacetum coccineum]|uniref:Uncharacterized protein n=1 Tax=Tanacetum coccineum TaxID=301880 RepID=A0ABQ5E2R8_9ASTR
MKDRLFIDTSKKSLACRVLYKVEDIATYLVEYVKFWDDWEVDRYGNANLVAGFTRMRIHTNMHVYFVVTAINYGVIGESWQRERILELKRRYFEDYYSKDQFAISIKEDTAYPCLHSLKTTEDEGQYAVSRDTQYAVFKI